jgi:D-alanyl-D-alanine carboxypeptidase
VALLIAGGLAFVAPHGLDGRAATSDGRAALQATLRAKARDLVAAGVPAVVVLVRRGDQTIRIAEGHVSRTSAETIRPTDRFRLGSLTKTYVATVVLQLVAAHRLALEDTVQRWLPGLVPNGASITVRELLMHRSGLYDYWGDSRFFAPYRGGDFAYRYTPRQLVEIATAHGPRFAPDTRFGYTNTGYIVLGLIVEAVTRRPLAVELRDRIFQPLHLSRTSFGRGGPGAGRNAHGYIRIGGRLRDVGGLNLSFDWAAGAVVSSADDVATFYRALLTGRLLTPALVRLMTTGTVRGVAGYGFGIMKRRLPCGTSWGHAGDTPGFVADAHSSIDGSRQAVALMSMELADLPRAARRAFFKLSARAYCGSVPAG